MFEVRWEEQALKELSKLDKSISARIFKKIGELSEGFKGKDVKYVQGQQNTYRVRVGEYRVIFKIQENFISVFMIGHRKNIYEKF